MYNKRMREKGKEAGGRGREEGGSGYSVAYSIEIEIKPQFTLLYLIPYFPILLDQPKGIETGQCDVQQDLLC